MDVYIQSDGNLHLYSSLLSLLPSLSSFIPSSLYTSLLSLSSSLPPSLPSLSLPPSLPLSLSSLPLPPSLPSLPLSLPPFPHSPPSLSSIPPSLSSLLPSLLFSFSTPQGSALHTCLLHKFESTVVHSDTITPPWASAITTRKNNKKITLYYV